MSRPICGFRPLVCEPTPTLGVPVSRINRQARWDGCAKRPPKKGEFYISGAIPAAYRAKQDMTVEYFIAVPIEE